MMLETGKDWFLFVALNIAMVTFVSWLAFARLTMARIDRTIVGKGLPRPCAWDGPGARVLLYAYVMILPKRMSQKIDIRLIDASLVRGLSGPADRVGGLILVIFSTLLGIICIAGGLLLEF
ncbi:hypothetical protein ACXYTJ_15390 [Gilvimarinus sp. F26214L]|uniref:hypothetical protein n=1 Tax=Gilvimarinus sp. DZF01 TaxID=3461371 RepID=UPI004045A106